MNLQPKFRVLANGNDVDEKLQDRIVEAKVTLRTGFVSDSCEVKFDNLAAAPIKLPKTEDKIEIHMGYKEGAEDKNASLTPLGEFEVGEVDMLGPFRSLNIYGNKIKWHQDFKSPKQRSWPEAPGQADSPQKQKLGDLISTVAGEHGFDAKVASKYSNTELPYIEQNESDMQLLTRLAEQYGAVMKVTQDKLVFMERGTGKSLSGQAMPEIKITNQQITAWHFNRSHFRLIGEVSAYYYDIEQAKKIKVTAGSGSPKLALPYTYSDESAATEAVTAKQQAQQRAHGLMRLEMVGDPSIIAGAVIKVEETESECDGKWYVKEVTHVINARGFFSQLSCEALS